MKKKILMGTKGADDMTSFLRAWGPFTMMKELELVKFPPGLEAYHEWHRFFDCDILFMHRPSSEFDLALMEVAQHYRIPLWVDHDDDLEYLTPDNPAYDVYNRSKARECVQFSIKNAIVLTVSGQAHQKRIRKDYDRNPILIPNTVHDRLLPLAKPWRSNSEISWRGSKSHFADLVYFQDAVSNVMKLKKLDWNFFGLCPYNLEWKAPNAKIKWSGPLEILLYYKELCALNASIQIVPLVDTYFNRVKSNLAWLDGTLAGSVVLGPDFEEWGLPGMISYKSNNNDSFLKNLIDLIDESDEFKRQKHKESMTYIKDCLLHSKWNNKRLEIINNL